ncbi:MAG: bifunctional oligoribonuclease/PAP phosphatase NrnA [Acidobacteria bacterium]|jgi:phosphoesterase RecJ-like protein|nr:MAG: bifunctional oligoribonuclease/PAP phosphatase NrnA [Acidobacteriota bacterium]
MVEESIPIIELLRKEEGPILIASHENPDADTLGSALALYLFLKKKGKRVCVGCKDEVPHFLDFLPGAGEVIRLPTDQVFSLSIVVDASGFHRIGAEVKTFKRARIDHHIGGEFYDITDYIDPSAPSTTALVYKLLCSWDRSAIDKDIAQNLYAGLATDTGFFKYSNTDARTFELAKELVEFGAEPHWTFVMFAERESINKLRLLSKVLDTLQVYHDGLVAGITIFDRFFKETGCKYADSEGLVNYPRSLEGVEVAYALIEKPDEGLWKVSLRSKGTVDVAKIAESLGGGGHKHASGCKIKARSYEEAVDRLITAIREGLEKNGLVKQAVGQAT